MINSKYNTFYVWGDSLLKGIIFDEARNRYALLKDNCTSALSRLLKIEIINRAKMGCTITKGKEILQRDLERGIKCDAAVVEFGGNDSDFYWNEISDAPDKVHSPKTELSVFSDHLKSMISLLRENDIAPVLVNLPPIDSVKYFDFISRGLDAENILAWLGSKSVIHDFHKQYSRSIDNVAAESNCILIDVRSAFLAQSDYSDLLCADGIHPNESGHRLIQDVFMGYATDNS
ncbi:MAG: SGNH/GDSL hydrolase family protein [Saccharofermentanales bacterium]